MCFLYYPYRQPSSQTKKSQQPTGVLNLPPYGRFVKKQQGKGRHFVITPHPAQPTTTMMWELDAFQTTYGYSQEKLSEFAYQFVLDPKEQKRIGAFKITITEKRVEPVQSLTVPADDNISYNNITDSSFDMSRFTFAPKNTMDPDEKSN